MHWMQFRSLYLNSPNDWRHPAYEQLDAGRVRVLVAPLHLFNDVLRELAVEQSLFDLGALHLRLLDQVLHGGEVALLKRVHAFQTDPNLHTNQWLRNLSCQAPVFFPVVHIIRDPVFHLLHSLPAPLLHLLHVLVGVASVVDEAVGQEQDQVGPNLSVKWKHCECENLDDAQSITTEFLFVNPSSLSILSMTDASSLTSSSSSSWPWK